MFEDNPLVVKARRFIRGIETRELNASTVRMVGLDAGRDTYSIAAKFLERNGIEGFNPPIEEGPIPTRTTEAAWEVERENSIRRAENARRKAENERTAAALGKSLRQLGRLRLPMLPMVDFAWYYRGKREEQESNARRELLKAAHEIREREVAEGLRRSERKLRTKKPTSATAKPTPLPVKRDEFGVRRPNVEDREFIWTPAKDVGHVSEGAYET